MAERLQKACAQPVWIITFKIGEIKLIANNNACTWVIIQNTSACLHAFKRSLGRNSRTLLSCFHPFPSPSRNSLSTQKQGRREACRQGEPSARAGEARGGWHRAGDRWGASQSPQPGTELAPAQFSPGRRASGLTRRQANEQGAWRSSALLTWPWAMGGIWVGSPGVPGHIPVLKCVVPPIYSHRILSFSPPLWRFCFRLENLPREEGGKGFFPGS